MINITDEELARKCFQYPQTLAGNLNIVYNAANSVICLWNKHQIFIHERLDFEDSAKHITPDFPVKEICLVSNYLLALDYNYNIYQVSLKFKSSAAKRSKQNFQIKDQNILTLKTINNDVISLKCKDNSYFICAYKVDADLQISKQILIKEYSKEIKPHLYPYKLTSTEFDVLKEVFNCRSSWSNHYLIIISVDKTVFGCLFSSTAEDIKLVQIYRCATTISDLKILKRNCPEIIIGLTTGTVIRLTLNRERNCDIVHLNTSICKFLEFDESIIYTDGLTLWKAESPFNDIKLKQFLVKQVKDIIKCREQIICTTYHNFIYILSVEDESCYLKPNLIEKYCSVDRLLNKTQYYNKLLEEINKLEILINKIETERNYIKAIALSNKHEVMDTVLSYSSTVFDNFEDLLYMDKIAFTDNPKDIFEKDMFLILISISCLDPEQDFKKILSGLLGDFRIHITLSTNKKILKTYTIKHEDELKKMNIVVTLDRKNLDLMKRLFSHVQLIAKVPGVLDENESLWISLHEKTMELTCDNFIVSSQKSNIIYLKQNFKDVGDSVLDTAIKKFNTFFEITKSENIKTNDWVFYVKLPSNYKEILESDLYKNFHSRKRQYLKEQTSELFIKSQTTLQLLVGNEKTEVEIINDGFLNPILKVSSANPKIALDMRNFFSTLIYNDYSGLDSDLFANWSLYTTLETLQREIKKFVESGTRDDFLEEHNTFQRNIIANLPIYYAFYLFFLDPYIITVFNLNPNFLHILNRNRIPLKSNSDPA
ncbi:uncharacterized protein LOC123714142 [Pieris brassicae]|uniref:uncharacterized protein LOC123714142 n=1 Tax=Pieris brassicae TaxID=7116 RepID=UPI001E65FDB8|nr:uncharacterized protein LOC123714142 [Pieris brassicae]